MPAKIPQHVRESQLNALPGKRFVRWRDGEYRNKNSKAVMQCDSGHEWAARVDNLLNEGNGCPHCAGQYRYSPEERIEQLSKLPGKRFVHWVDGEYRNAYSKAVMLCSEGHEWSASVVSLLNQKTGCPTCGGNYRYSKEERVEQLNSLEGFRFVRWLDGYQNSASKAVVRCDKGHEWAASCDKLINNRSGCPHCAGQYRYSPEERIEQLNSLPAKCFVRWVDGEYKDARSKAVMRCSASHQWAARVDDLVNKGNGCPHCAKSGFNPEAPAVLYALRSECGRHVKIGITGHLNRRLAKLKRVTPFEFAIIATVEGKGRDIRDLEKMFHGEFSSSELTSFDGATEWLTFNPQILSLLRILGA